MLSRAAGVKMEEEEDPPLDETFGEGEAELAHGGGLSLGEEAL